MAAVRELPGLRLIRPLLDVLRARLATLLDARRGRNICATRATATPRSSVHAYGRSETSMRRLSTACGNGVARIERERHLAALSLRAVVLHPAGFAVIDPAPPSRRANWASRRSAASPPASAAPVTRCGASGSHDCAPGSAMRRGSAAPSAGAASSPGAPRAGDSRIRPGGRRRCGSFRAGRPSGIGALAQPCRSRRRSRLPSRLSGPLGWPRRRWHAATDDNILPRLIYPTLPAVWDEAGLAAVPHVFYRRPGTGILPRGVPPGGAAIRCRVYSCLIAGASMCSGGNPSASVSACRRRWASFRQE